MISNLYMLLLVTSFPLCYLILDRGWVRAYTVRAIGTSKRHLQRFESDGSVGSRRGCVQTIESLVYSTVFSNVGI